VKVHAGCVLCVHFVLIYEITGSGSACERVLTDLLDLLRSDPDEQAALAAEGAAEPAAPLVGTPRDEEVDIEAEDAENRPHASFRGPQRSHHRRTKYIVDDDSDDSGADLDPFEDLSRSTYDKGSKTSSHSSGGTPRLFPIDGSRRR
jgi:hypothetical protein